MHTTLKNLSRRAFAMLGALCLLGLPLLRAQTAPPAPTAQPTTAATGADEAVRLTPFVVSESEDRGYAATSTSEATPSMMKWLPVTTTTQSVAIG